MIFACKVVLLRVVVRTIIITYGEFEYSLPCSVFQSNDEKNCQFLGHLECAWVERTAVCTFVQAERKVASLAVVANRLRASHLPQIRSTGRAANCGIHNRVCASHFQPQPTRAHFTPRLNYLLTLQRTARPQASITHSDFARRGFIVARLVVSSYYCAIELRSTGFTESGRGVHSPRLHIHQLNRRP